MVHGPTRVMVLVRRGLKGVAFSSAFNRCKSYPELPRYDDERCKKCIWGETHHGVLNLLKADFSAELVDEQIQDIGQREDAELKRRQLEAKRWVSTPQAGGRSRTCTAFCGPSLSSTTYAAHAFSACWRVISALCHAG
jgi:hypothetical protein